jgi:hypothetical protein
VINIAAGTSATRRRFSFWAIAFAFLILLAFSTAPSPLYVLYAQRDHFSSFTITLISGAYALGVVASLFLVAGGFVGAGASALLKGTLGTVISISTPDTLGESLTGFFLSGYFGLSIPAIAVGIALQFISLKDTLLAFAIIVSLGIMSALRRLLGAQRTAPSAGADSVAGTSRAAAGRALR